MGGGGGGSNDGVEYQREQEEARQARIRDGMSRIEDIFSGPLVTTGYTGAINPAQQGVQAQTYYDKNGRQYNLTSKNTRTATKRWAPGTTIYSNLGNGYEALPDQLYTGIQQERQGGFGDDFFDNRAKAYTDYALPQLQDQYKDQQKALAFALSRGGNLGSSVAAAKTADLDKDYSLQQQNVYDKGQDYVNQGKADLNTQKQNLVSMLQASADPDATANLAQASAQSLSTMPTFSPLSPVISNVASGLGTYLTNQQTADAVRKAYTDSYTNPLSRSSGKVG